MRWFVIYDNNGRIKQTMNANDETDLSHFEDPYAEYNREDVGEISDYYVAGSPPSLIQRPELPTTIDKTQVVEDIEAVNITCPINTNIQVEGIVNAETICESGTESIIFDYPAIYTLTLIKFPYLQKQYTIEVLSNEGGSPS